jgi:GH25 family lysozyme M1 (1,4-beta-N-acetylmuramidase)
MCLSILNKRHLDYPVFLDVEQSEHKAMTSDQLAPVVAAFCKTITDAGYRAAIYSNSSLYNTGLSSTALNVYDKWIAEYGATAPNYSGAYTMWQYSSQGTVPGISTAVDMDYSYMNYPQGGAASTDTSLISDTGATLNLKLGKSYQFKFTPNGTNAKPSFSTGNSGVIKTVSISKQGNSYYVKITAVGRGGTGVYSTLPNKKAVSRCAVTVS